MKPESRRFGLIWLLVGTGIILIAAFVVGQRPNEAVPRVRGEMNGIARAIFEYQARLKSFPEGTNVAVARKLFGENSLKMPFLAWQPHRLSPGGELLDPWGTAYDISVRADGNVDIRSAGEDRLFWTKDDDVF